MLFGGFVLRWVFAFVLVCVLGFGGLFTLFLCACGLYCFVFVCLGCLV